MVVLLWITTILLVIGIGIPGVMKLTRNPTAVEAAERLGYTKLMMPLGVVEVLGPIGLVIGAAVDDLAWLGATAAVGIMFLMFGALIYHLRAKDTKELAPSAVLLALAVLYIVALAAS